MSINDVTLQSRPASRRSTGIGVLAALIALGVIAGGLWLWKSRMNHGGGWAPAIPGSTAVCAPGNML